MSISVKFISLDLKNFTISIKLNTKWLLFRPKEVDELVLCKRADDDWLRGKVLSVGPPVKVATLDDARVCLAELCFRMPPSVAELCTFGGTCTLIENDFKVIKKGK